MRNVRLTAISILLVIFTLIGTLASCGDVITTSATQESTASTEQAASETTISSSATQATDNSMQNGEATVETEGTNDTEESSCGSLESGDVSENVIATEDQTDSYKEDIATTNENLENNDGENESSATTATPDGGEEVGPPPVVNDYTNVIENANSAANGVQSFYNADRSHYIVRNNNVTLDYRLIAGSSPMVESLKNSKGDAYLTECMDVYATTVNGQKYYASGSLEQARVNVYRLGYYYYDVHILEQDFVGSVNDDYTFKVPVESFTGKKHVTDPVIENGVLTTTIANQEDPQIFATTTCPTSDVNYLQFSFKGNSVGYITVYLIAGNQTAHTDKQSFTVEVTSDGSWHTYTVPLNSDTIPGYDGNIKGIRLDFGGAVNTPVSIKDVSFKHLTVDSIPLSLDRVFHTFPDKLHQEIHVVAYKDTTNVEEIGVEYKIPVDNVTKFVAKDASGLVYNLKQIDPDTLEFIAFDVKDVGVIGFILPYDAENYSLKAITRAKNYLITLEGTPEDNTILAPLNSTVNDFRMGCRIYTDETHDFSEFLKEAYCERNPLTDENIVIDAEKFVRGAKFKGYDGLRGVYQITIKGATTFNDPYYHNQNLHYNASFNIKGDGYDRSIYMMTYTASGLLECAAIMNEDNILLPIPLQVSKNFSEKEEPFYNCGDATYGETFFPISLGANEDQYYTVLNFYQNWGNYPLKQLSSIGYYMPYYHLSTGVTESNCISPWYNRGKNLWTLPDHRPASMPMSSDLTHQYAQYGNQPQTPNAGLHYFLQYTDADGKYVTSEYLDNRIDSYGPTYADLTMNYLSDDGNIKVSYRHVEMPQTDENRAYYEMTYEVLDEVVIENFRNDFSFYTMTGFMNYEKLGFLRKNGDSFTKNVNTGTKPDYTELGSECPYFDLYYCSRLKEYANISFLIYDASFVIGGKETSPGFVIVDHNYAVKLTLNLNEKVTLQKGDKFVIKCIIMPWGGGYIQDDGSEKGVQYHPTTDTNVQNVRLNTLLNPFKATAVSDCIASDSWFLPQVRSTNGKSATFTVSGGYDITENVDDNVNVTVRADGFSALARPKVEVLEGDKWVSYDLCSLNNPDSSGRGVNYDGYQVHYNEDGTYSYSFVITITDGVSKTFRISAQ